MITLVLLCLSPNLSLIWAKISDLKLSNFQHFDVEFNSTCDKFFWMHGYGNDLYLTREHEHFQLWVGNNSSYKMYVLPWSETIIFTWPDVMINNEPMSIVKSAGDIQWPPKFNYVQLLCDVIGIKVGSLIKEEVGCQVYKCPTRQCWKLSLPLAIGVGGVIVILLMIYGLKEAIPRCDFSGGIQRFRNILSRSKETISKSEEKRYSPVLGSSV